MGERWDRAVETALRSCSGLLVILSPTSVDSTNVMDEVSYALEENKRVFPIVYKSCEVPFRLRRLQHTDLSEDYDAGLTRVVQDFKDRTKSWPVVQAGASVSSEARPDSSSAPRPGARPWLGKLLAAAIERSIMGISEV